MTGRLSHYSEGFDWVLVEATQRFNISRREWTNGRNLSFDEGQRDVVARDGRGMSYYIDQGFFEVVDETPFNREPGENTEEDNGEEEGGEGEGVCSVEKQDGEVCGRDLPCPYHGDNDDEEE